VQAERFHGVLCEVEKNENNLCLFKNKGLQVGVNPLKAFNVFSL
jgi:hypothetical protein